MFDTLMACAILSTMGAIFVVAFKRNRLMQLFNNNEVKLLAFVGVDILFSTAVLFGITVLVTEILFAG